MKNKLLNFLVSILTSAIYLYILGPILIVGATTWLWMPFFIGDTVEQKATMFVFGIIISISTVSIARAVKAKLENL